METIVIIKSAKEAIDKLKPKKWSETGAKERIELLENIRENLKTHADALAESDAVMKNERIGEDVISLSESLVATAVPIALTITACITLYEALVKDTMLKPLSINKINDAFYDVEVFPQEIKDKIIYADRKDYLRVKVEPVQINPLDKPTGIIAVLGAGNYSSPVEVLKALFLENCVVVHKPHQLNQATNRIWEKIMEPFVSIGALSFCDASQGKALTKDERLHMIYFTGSTDTAKIIKKATNTLMVTECGGNNPCIIVPSENPWSEKEMHHQALQIASMAKLNGGAVCGRVQTLVTSKHWTQRAAFLKALKQALQDETLAASSYYPGATDVMDTFKKHYPNADLIHPREETSSHSDFLFISDHAEDGYALKNEAFSQVLVEVPLDIPANASEFLSKAVTFCNTKLMGTLASSILIDEETKKNSKTVLDKAITDLQYGSIAINSMPPFIFINPYLTWGGNEEGKELVSGQGNFGNLLCYVNVEKSISHCDFMSAGHLIITDKEATEKMFKNMARYAIEPTWRNLTRVMAMAVRVKLKKNNL